MIDLICAGRAMVDLYCDQVGSPLTEAQSLSMYVGGCPANVAVGTARLGLQVAMLTRVGDDTTGRFLKRTLEREGVDASRVRPDPQARTPMVMAEIQPPDRFSLTWYRERAADLCLQPEDFDPEWLGTARALLVSGHSMSTEAAARVAQELVRQAREAGLKVVYDIDFRPLLWKRPDVQEALCAPLPFADLVVGTEEEYAATGDRVRELAPQATWVLKLGPRGARAAEPGQEPVEEAGFPVEVLNTLGAGDAFLSGFLFAWLDGLALEQCLRFGNANGALVVTRHGCAPAMPYRDELLHFMTRTVTGPHRARPDRDPSLNRLHAAGALPPARSKLFALALDHRTWFAQRCKDFGRIREFKRAACEAAAERARAGGWADSLGFILDGLFAEEALQWAEREGYWVAQCLEQSNSYPLQIEGCDPALALRARPRGRAVKLLAYWDFGAASVVVHQTDVLHQVQAACHAYSREFLLEILRRDQARAVHQEVSALVRAGLRPDWWKLPVPDGEVDPVLFKRIGEDPCSRGILWLGGGEPLEELEARFAGLSGLGPSRGFAVGRTVFEAPFHAFLAGTPARE
ncbi:MAG: 5-dehydro-2-deoxygluconokinase, partial [Candidatus Eremiobacterota bacterium]